MWLLDTGSVAAVCVALERTAYYALRFLGERPVPHTRPAASHPGWHPSNERHIMSSTTPDPYAGARAMGITVPPAEETGTPIPEGGPSTPESTSPSRPGTGNGDSADYAAYLRWKQDMEAETPEAAPGAVKPSAVTIAPTADAQTANGAVIADITAAESTVSAVAPGLADRLRSIIGGHQSLIDEMNDVLAEVEKF